MTRPLRLEFPGSLWHVTTRGNEKRAIFHDDDDRKLFLQLLGDCVERFDWILPAYVLMLNHFHLVVHLRIESLSRGMHWLNGQYARKFNKRYGRVGHFFQGRFKGILVQRETHARELARYVVLNPVRAKIASGPGRYEWSSYRAVMGLDSAPSWLAVDDVLAPFALQRKLARRRYHAFVDAGIGLQTSPWSDLIGQMFLGTEAWVKEMQDKIDVKPRSDENPRKQRKIGIRSMSDIVAGVARTLSVDEERVRHSKGMPRQIAAWIGWNEALLTGRQIAEGFGNCSAQTVSRIIRTCDSERGANGVLSEMITRCISTIRRKNGEW